MMNKQFFSYYQYIGPMILAPLSFWLWWTTYEGNMTLTLVAWLIPVLFAYIVPGIGTNVLKVWEFNTRYRLGRFRPHHGFVFGSATAMMAWVCHTQSAVTATDVLQYGFILASVLGFWNVIYDIKAIKAGILIVYNQPWAEGKEAESITMDYAPVFFAGFGLMHGLGIGFAEVLDAREFFNGYLPALYLVLLLGVAIAFPVILYRRNSFAAHGHSGCSPIHKPNENPEI